MSDMIEVTPELMAGFLDEAPSYLTALEEGLMAFEQQAHDGVIALRDSDDHERMNTIFRAAHSLKGIAASLGFNRIRDLTHLMESLFDQLRNGIRQLHGVEMEGLFSTVDTLRKLVDELNDPPETPVALDSALSTLSAMLDSPTDAHAPAASVASAPAAAPDAPAPIASAQSESMPTATPPIAPTISTDNSASEPAINPVEDVQIVGSDVGDDLIQRFSEATNETLDELDRLILEIEKRTNDPELIQSIFRCAHNIKGASGAVGCTHMHRFTHDMESVLDRVRDGSLTLDSSLCGALFAASDFLRAGLAGVVSRDAQPLSRLATSELFNQWLGESTGKAADGAQPAQPIAQSVAPAATVEAEADMDENEHEVPTIAVSITFAADFDEAAVYSCMIYNRLADLGDVLKSEPDVFALKGDAPDRKFTYTVRTTSDAAALERLVRAYSVESVNVHAPQPTAAAAGAPAAASRPAPAPVAAAKPASSAAVPTTPAVAAKRPDAPAAKPAEGNAAPVKAGETLRVDLERLDQLMNLGGELVITKARFGEITRKLNGLFPRTNLGYLVDDIADRLTRMRSDLDRLQTGEDTARTVANMSDSLLHLTHDFGTVQTLVRQLYESRATMSSMGEAVHSLNRISEGMQKRIMETRMVAIGPLFQRFRRVLRDLCKSTGKKVELVLRGEATELDKRMIDELVDPLTHMVRNSVDHGIESPEERIAAGKPEFGQIILDAVHRGRHICIEVVDDGRGISAEKVRRKIIERELATPAAVEQMSDQEAYQYVFKSGFSTAEKVTDLSGRGMGMDIVKTKIEGVNGAVTLDSKPGEGAKFTIQLPLTLAIVNAMMVRIGSTVYAVPLDMVIEIIPIQREAVQHIQGRAVIRVREHVVPLALLEEALSLSNDEQHTQKRFDPQFTVLVLGMQNDRLGLVVDHLIGQENIVIKDVGTNYRNIDGVAGASIMGDGSVSLILDVAALLMRFARRGAGRSWLADAPSQPATPSSQPKPALVETA